tara:strand:- start:283 stop:921 length:639 start_codon:yes stop_codon:yes gene_type:complete
MCNFLSFKSNPKNNPFAPEWHYVFVEQATNNIDIKSLTSFLLKKEKDILKFKSGNDGFTGLGKKSITSKHGSYNLFNFKNKEITKLKKNIVKLHETFLRHCELSIPNVLFIKGWYNILRKGEKIKPHLHDVSPDSYLGGHFCIQSKDTSTYYICPVNQINKPNVHKSLNTPGKLTLFQNCIPHYTDTNKSSIKRITIAFDLSLVRKDWINVI